MKEQKYREARKAAGIKAEQAAATLGVSIATLFSWERGDTSPDAYKLREMAKLYDITADELLCLA